LKRINEKAGGVDNFSARKVADKNSHEKSAKDRYS